MSSNFYKVKSFVGNSHVGPFLGMSPWGVIWPISTMSYQLPVKAPLMITSKEDVQAFATGASHTLTLSAESYQTLATSFIPRPLSALNPDKYYFELPIYDFQVSNERSYAHALGLPFGMMLPTVKVQMKPKLIALPKVELAAVDLNNFIKYGQVVCQEVTDENIVPMTIDYLGVYYSAEINRATQSLTIMPDFGPRQTTLLTTEQLLAYLPDTVLAPLATEDRPSQMGEMMRGDDYAERIADYQQLANRDEQPRLLIALYREAVRLNQRAQQPSLAWQVYTSFFADSEAKTFQQKAQAVNQAIDELTEQAQTADTDLADLVEQALQDVNSPLRQALHLHTARRVELTTSELALGI